MSCIYEFFQAVLLLLLLLIWHVFWVLFPNFPPPPFRNFLSFFLPSDFASLKTSQNPTAEKTSKIFEEQHHPTIQQSVDE
jgi:hypothetical protein